MRVGVHTEAIALTVAALSCKKGELTKSELARSWRDEVTRVYLETGGSRDQREQVGVRSALRINTRKKLAAEGERDKDRIFDSANHDVLRPGGW